MKCEIAAIARARSSGASVFDWGVGGIAQAPRQSAAAETANARSREVNDMGQEP